MSRTTDIGSSRDATADAGMARCSGNADNARPNRQAFTRTHSYLEARRERENERKCGPRSGVGRMCIGWVGVPKDG